MEVERPVWPDQAIWRASDLDEAARAIQPEARRFQASDGYPLASLIWPARGDRPRARLILLHGVQSHAGWYHGLGRRLAAAGFECHFPDRRGSGANARERGHARSAQRLVDDVLEYAGALNDDRPKVLGGISWGAKLALVAAARDPKIDSLLLIFPGLHPQVDVTLRQKLGVALALLTGQGARRTFPIPLADPSLFTQDPAGQSFISGDPLSLRAATANLLFASRVLDRMVATATNRVETPLLAILAEHDRIADNARTRGAFERFPSRIKRLVELEGTCHTPEFDANSAVYARSIIDWLGARQDEPWNKTNANSGN